MEESSSNPFSQGWNQERVRKTTNREEATVGETGEPQSVVTSGQDTIPEKRSGKPEVNMQEVCLDTFARQDKKRQEETERGMD